MKVLENTLAPEVESWDDPGDYPSGAGGGPLPSYNYVICEGSLVVFLTTEEWGEGDWTAQEVIDVLEGADLLELPEGIESLDDWQFSYVSNKPVQTPVEGGVKVELYPERCEPETTKGEN